jgi:hypothetical protein
MATSYDHITDEQAQLIRDSRVFFVASVAPDLSRGPAGQGPVNLSPKGGTPLHVIDQHRVAYLDYTGSGDETARHAGGPVTLMVMSMSRSDAAVVRLFGTATVSDIDASPLRDRVLGAPADDIALPPRQVIDVRIEGTQTSCGYGVPVYDFVAQRTVSERGRCYKET